MTAREERGTARPDALWLRDYLKARLTVWGLDLWSFWNKLHRDWVLKFASMLAYQFMLALFPLLLFMLGVYGMIAPLLSRADAADVQQGVSDLLPLGIGPAAVGAAFARLHHASGLLLVLGLVLAIGSGAHLFYTLQDCANIIFRLQSRHYLIKQTIAIGAMLLYCGVVPFAFAFALAPVHWLHMPAPHGWPARGLAFLFAWIAASCLLALLYKITTEGAIAWRAVWPGAIIASLLLIVYEQIFPIYVHTWLKPDNYGALAGFILIVLAFFYYLAFIVLLGMEITSWRAGQREMGASLPTIIHAVQVNRSLRGVAGPTAGKPSEDLNKPQTGDEQEAGSASAAKQKHKKPAFLWEWMDELRGRFDGEHRRPTLVILWMAGAVALALLAVAAHAFPVFPGDVGIAEVVQLLRFTPLPPLINLTSDLNWPTPAGVISVSVILALVLARQIRAAIGLAVATYSADAANILINGAVGRPRPHNVHIISPVHVGLHSFPSGHVSHSVAFYGFVLMLLIAAHARVAPRERLAVRFLQGCCIFMIVFIGISRVLEGQHWPSDVLGGYILGSLCLMLGIAVYQASRQFNLRWGAGGS